MTCLCDACSKDRAGMRSGRRSDSGTGWEGESRDKGLGHDWGEDSLRLCK